MKIGIIAYDLSSLAGGQNLSFTLGKELQKLGHEIAYACVYENLNNLIDKFGGECNFKIYKQKTPIFGRKLTAYNTLFNHSFPIYSMCKKFKPNIVIETGGYPSSLTIPILLKIPSIHYCIYPPSQSCSEKNFLFKIYLSTYKILEKIIAKKTQICTISKCVTKLIKKLWDVDSKVIYPPTNTEAFSPSKKRKNIILCVLRYVPDYKFENMIDAFIRLERNDFSLYIVGGLHKKHINYYNFLKKKIKNKKNIKLFSNVDFNQLLKIYKEAKIFWFPIGSPYGIAIVEAQSSGLPTITFGSDWGSGEIVINEKTGFHVNNFDEMIEKTKILINNENLLKKMSIASRKNAIERFNLKTFGDNFTEFIGECLQKH